MSANTDETADSGHVGPIIFANDIARAQLEEHGEVTTFRTSDRTTGDTWWRTSRTGPKEGDVHVEQVAEVDPATDDLAEYWELSGFDSVEHWREAIQDVHGSLETGYVYRTTTRGGSDE